MNSVSRMSAIGQLIRDLLGAFGVEPSPWLLGPIMGVLLLVSWPMMKTNRATQRARRLITAAPLRPRPERERLGAEALALVAGNVVGLLVVAEEATRAGLRETASSAIVQLEATGKRPLDVRRLRRELEPSTPQSPLIEAAAVDRLRAEGLDVLANQRLAKALERWPEDEGLLALRQSTEPTTTGEA